MSHNILYVFAVQDSNSDFIYNCHIFSIEVRTFRISKKVIPYETVHMAAWHKVNENFTENCIPNNGVSLILVF